MLGRLFGALLLLFSLKPLPIAAADSNVAMLVMSTDRTRSWTKLVRKIVREAQLPCPYQVFFGNADTGAQFSELQTYLRDLEDEGATEIVVVPLLTSSYSRILKQWRYLLGADLQPGFNNVSFFPIRTRSNIRFVDPLNDSALVVEVLLDRAQEVSTQRDQEHVLVMAQGTADESDNAGYLRILHSVAQRLKGRGQFKSVEGFTLRDAAPPDARLRAMQSLRGRVQALSEEGDRVIIVPLMLSTGGLEHKLSLELRGLPYVFNTKALLPDSRISEWIRSQVP